MAKYTSKNKVYTDASMLDEMEHNIKLMLNHIVLKDTEEALKYETQASIDAADAYVAIKDGNAGFMDFTYTHDMYIAANKYIVKHPSTGLTQLSNIEINAYLADSTKVPKGYRDILVKIASDRYVENYVEYNDYYRKLNGQKPYGAADFYVDPIYIKSHDLDQFVSNDYSDPYDYLNSVPITDFTQYQITILNNTGVIDRIVQDHPELQYLLFLGSNSIDIYKARKAERFQLLYLPEAEEIVRVRFQDILEANRGIYLRRYYSDAYKFENPYYDKFMIVMLIAQSAQDLITEIPEWYIRRDVFDVRTAQYILESNGIQFFPEIPLKYQISMVRAMNTLIKYKSTTKNIYDIAKVFFLKNINVFKYYLIKKRNISLEDDMPLELDGGGAEDMLGYEDINGGIASTESDIIYDGGTAIKNVNYVSGEDLEKKYSLEFVKVPVDSTLDNYLRDDIYKSQYDTITMSDKYWDGEKDHKYVKQEILRKDFTSQCTKYLSLQTTFNASEYLFQLTYFLNMIMNNNIDTTALSLKIPIINSNSDIQLRDIIVLLYILSFKYFENATDDLIFVNNRDPHPHVNSVDFNIKGDINIDDDNNIDGGGAEDQDLDNGYYMCDGGYAQTWNGKYINCNGGRARNIKYYFQPETYEIPYNEVDDAELDGLGVINYENPLDVDGGNAFIKHFEVDRMTSDYDGGYAINGYLYNAKDSTAIDVNDPCAPYAEPYDKFRYPILSMDNRIVGFNLEANLDELEATVSGINHPKFEWLRGFTLEEILPTRDLPMVKYQTINHFPKKGVINTIYVDMSNNAFYMWGIRHYYPVPTLYSKGIKDFRVPTDAEYKDIKQLVDIYKTNKEIYDNLTEALRDVDDQDELYIMQYIYDYLFTMEWHLDYFDRPMEDRLAEADRVLPTLVDRTSPIVTKTVHDMIVQNKDAKEIAKALKEKYNLKMDDESISVFQDAIAPRYKRYSEFLKKKDGVLYGFYEKLMSENNINTRQYNMANNIDDIIGSIETYLNTEGLDYIFYFVPTVSWGITLKYISLVLNFFKSYKTHILDISGTVKFDDRTENTMTQSDKIWVIGNKRTKAESAGITDTYDINASMVKTDEVETDDRIYFHNEYDQIINLDGGNYYKYTNAYVIDTERGIFSPAGAEYSGTTNIVDFDGGGAMAEDTQIYGDYNVYVAGYDCDGKYARNEGKYYVADGGNLADFLNFPIDINGGGTEDNGEIAGVTDKPATTDVNWWYRRITSDDNLIDGGDSTGYALSYDRALEK